MALAGFAKAKGTGQWLTESHTLSKSNPLPFMSYFYSIFFMFSIISSVVTISSFPLHEC